MSVRQCFSLAAFLLAVLTAGCTGGRGSSGFDINNENATISQALETQQCLDFQGLRICSATASAAAGTPRVDTDLGNATSINCFQQTLGGPCTLTLTFVPLAFPSGTTFRVLARADAASGPWVLGTNPVPAGGSDGASLTATVVLTTAQGGPPPQAQLAILSFTGTPPSSPPEVQALHDTAATSAFVTPVLATRTVLATGDSVSGFGTIGYLPWDSTLHCLAADGRVAAVASSTTGQQALVCTDANGPQLVVQSGTIAPDGFAFTDFAYCSFADDGALIFAGSRAVPTDNSGTLTIESSVYRASANGIERLLGDGDVVSTGSPFEFPGSVGSFLANAKGSILAYGDAAGGWGLFLRHDGRLDVVLYGAPAQWGLADNDDVVMLDWLGEGRPSDTGTGPLPANALLVWRSGRMRVIARVDDSALPGAPYGTFGNLLVRGNLAIFSAVGGQDHDRYFWYRADDDTLREVSVDLTQGSLLDITPGGGILERITGGIELVNADGSQGPFVPDPPTRSPNVTPLPTDAPALTAFGINDRGNIALYAYANPPDSTRETIELAGAVPDAAAHCPQPLIPPTGATPAATQTQTPTPTAAPIVGVGPYRAYASDTLTNTVTVIDTATQDLLATVPARYSPAALALAVSADGTRLFVLANTWVDVLDTATMQRMHSIPLGEWGASIVAAPQGLTAYVNIPTTRFGGARLAVIDADAGLATSMLVPPGSVFSINPGDGYLLATATGRNPCNSQSELMEIDPTRSTIVRQITVGSAAGAATVSPDGTRVYVADWCTGQLAVVDLASFTVVKALPIEQGAGGIVVRPDGHYAYTTDSGYGYGVSSDGSIVVPQGMLSAVDLMAGTSAPIAISGGGTGRVAVTPDGLLVYTTVSPGDFGGVAVIDVTSKMMVTSLLPAGAASDVVVASAPSAPAPTPPPRVVLQADNAVGVVGDVIPLVVRMHSSSLDVGAIEHDLVAPAGAQLQARPDGPDCWVNPAVAAVATFEFLACPQGCNRVHVKIAATEPGTSLPHDGPLYTCNIRAQYFVVGLNPILISGATAVDPAGQPLPALGGDSELQILPQGDATPQPTGTPPSTATPTTTATPTRTMLPVVIEIGSVTVQPGAQASVSVILHTNGAGVVGLQNDITFTPSAPIGAAPTGGPDCTVNPAIAKPNTVFTFQPVGCDATQGDCTGIRALVLSLDNLSVIADHSVLYTCLVDVPPAAPAGTFPLHASAVYASDATGSALPATAIDGYVIVRDLPQQGPSLASTATATGTHFPIPVASPTPTPSATVEAVHLSYWAG